jgi:hypothetical protein
VKTFDSLLSYFYQKYAHHYEKIPSNSDIFHRVLQVGRRLRITKEKLGSYCCCEAGM